MGCSLHDQVPYPSSNPVCFYQYCLINCFICKLWFYNWWEHLSIKGSSIKPNFPTIWALGGSSLDACGLSLPCGGIQDSRQIASFEHGGSNKVLYGRRTRYSPQFDFTLWNFNLMKICTQAPWYDTFCCAIFSILVSRHIWEYFQVHVLSSKLNWKSQF